MAKLFNRDYKNIRKHINYALEEELSDQVVVAKFENTTQHGAIEGKTQTHYIKNISPMVNGSGQSIAGSNNWPTTIYGASPEYLSIRDWSVEKGSMFTEDDIESYAKVAVIGKTVQENLFPNENHEFYQKKVVATIICNQIIEQLLLKS